MPSRIDMHIDRSAARLGSRSYSPHFGFTDDFMDRSAPRLVIQVPNRKHWRLIIAAASLVVGGAVLLGSALTFVSICLFIIAVSLFVLARWDGQIASTELLEIDRSYVTVTRGKAVRAWPTYTTAPSLRRRGSSGPKIAGAVEWGDFGSVYWGEFGRDLTLEEADHVIDSIRTFLGEHKPVAVRFVPGQQASLEIQRS